MPCISWGGAGNQAMEDVVYVPVHQESVGTVRSILIARVGSFIQVEL
jgi:hypothetical protein